VHITAPWFAYGTVRASKAQLFFVCFPEKTGSKSSKQWVPKLVPSFCHRFTVTMFIGSAAWNFLGQGRKNSPPQPNKNVKILRARFSVCWHKHCVFWPCSSPALGDPPELEDIDGYGLNVVNLHEALWRWGFQAILCWLWGPDVKCEMWAASNVRCFSWL
jgi:hypothetical protein